MGNIKARRVDNVMFMYTDKFMGYIFKKFNSINKQKFVCLMQWYSSFYSFVSEIVIQEKYKPLKFLRRLISLCLFW